MALEPRTCRTKIFGLKGGFIPAVTVAGSSEIIPIIGRIVS